MTLTQRDRFLRRAAFTLMEMLVVVAIIVVLAGLGGYYFMGRLEAAKVDSASIQAKNVGEALETYKIDYGYYPSSLGELLQVDTARGKGPYLDREDALYDPWGQPYGYDPNGGYHQQLNFVVITADVFTVVPDGTGKIVGNWKAPIVR